jgi:ATP-dependent RNA helicase DDX10/DBP4
MAFVNSQASSSKVRPKQSPGQLGKPKVKSNQAKRAKVDDELKDLQSRVDCYVRLELNLQSF